MSRHTVAVVWIAFSLTCCLPDAAAEQPGSYMGATPPPQTIVGTGTVMLTRPPTAIRMHLEVLAKGKTLAEALTNLKVRRQTIQQELEKLQADKRSISFSNPSLSNLASARRKQFELMVRQRLGSRKTVPKGLQLPPSVTVSTTVTVEWPLPAGSPEETLLAAQSVRDKVKAADLAGTQKPEELSPEEAEMAEEMAEMMRDNGEEEIPIGQPHFVYVAEAPAEQREQATAKAFAKAKADAASLAKAAGVKLGPLVSLSGSGGGSSILDYDNNPYGYGYARQAYLQALMQRGANRNGQEDQHVCVGADPDKLQFRFHVQAVFRMVP